MKWEERHYTIGQIHSNKAFVLVSGMMLTKLRVTKPLIKQHIVLHSKVKNVVQRRKKVDFVAYV